MCRYSLEPKVRKVQHNNNAVDSFLTAPFSYIVATQTKLEVTNQHHPSDHVLTTGIVGKGLQTDILRLGYPHMSCDNSN